MTDPLIYADEKELEVPLLIDIELSLISFSEYNHHIDHYGLSKI